MEKKKEYKSNANYFTRGDILKIIGIGFMVLAGVMYFFGRGIVSYITMSIGLPLGAILLVINTFGRSTESDIDAYVKKHTEGIEHKTDNLAKFEKRLLKNMPIQTIEGYEYTDGLMYKKGKNGQVRSSKYSKAVIYPMDTGLCICYRKISVVSDEIENNDIEIPFDSITVFEMNREEKKFTIGKNPVKVKKTCLVIESADGASLSLPIQDSLMTEDYVKKMKSLIEKSKAV